MKQTKIATVTPILIEGSFVIALDQKWSKICKSSFCFDVLIKQGRLILEGPLLAKPFRKIGDKSKSTELKTKSQGEQNIFKAQTKGDMS